MVGGWELGAIFGTHLRLREILAHCSPSAQASGALELNAALADRRLDGKRSERVERLGEQHGGKGSRCDFLSIHAYNRSELAAAKFIRAKSMALETDAEYFRDLWIVSHECCPSWRPPQDQAAAERYLGNGYYVSWCLDLAQRMLLQAAKDGRYGFGEYALTIWPPPVGFAGVNTLYRRMPVDEDGDHKPDRYIPVPDQVFWALTLLSDFGPDYFVLPQRQFGGHVVGAFASRNREGTIRVAVYSHHGLDIQSRSRHRFSVRLALSGLRPGQGYELVEYPFDRDHHTYVVEAIEAGLEPVIKPPVLPRALVERAVQNSRLRPARSSTATVSHEGTLVLRTELPTNALSFLVLRPRTTEALPGGR